jgi:hypothetical protein
MGVSFSVLGVPGVLGGGDTVAPTCVLTSAASDPVGAAFSVTATFSEAVTGLALGDITVTNGAASNLAGSGTTYTFDVTPAGLGSVGVMIPANVVIDPAGNNNTASNTLTRENIAFAFTFADSGAPTGWTGTWTQDGAGNLNPVVTEGSNVVVNGNMETGSPPGTWSGTSAILSAAADERTGGAGVQSLQIAENGATSFRAAQSVTLTQYEWYVLKGWIKKGTATNGLIRDQGNGLQTDPVTSAAWTAVKRTHRATTAAVSIRLNCTGTADGQTMFFDDVIMAPLSGYRELYTFPRAYGTFTLNVTRTGSTQAGIILNYQDASNYASVYLDGAGNVVYDKRVAGVPTNIGTYAITYMAGTALVVTRHQDGTVDITYNGASLVTGATASGFAGTVHGLFGTDNGTQMHTLAYTAVGVS